MDEIRLVPFIIQPFIKNIGLFSGIEASIIAFDTGELAIGNLPGNASDHIFLGSGYSEF